MNTDNTDYTTITVYGLQTEKRIAAIKTLRSVYEAVNGSVLGLKLSKETCDTLSDARAQAQVVIRVPSNLASLVRVALTNADFILHLPERETILYV